MAADLAVTVGLDVVGIVLAGGGYLIEDLEAVLVAVDLIECIDIDQRVFAAVIDLLVPGSLQCPVVVDVRAVPLEMPGLVILDVLDDRCLKVAVEMDERETGTVLLDQGLNP